MTLNATIYIMILVDFQTVNQTAKASDNGETLRCQFYTDWPVYSLEDTVTLNTMGG